MLSAILSSIGGSLVDKMFAGVADIFKAYWAKEISETEAKTRLLSTIVGAARDVEVTQAQEITKTYQVFMTEGMKYREVRAVWFFVTTSQLLVLLWHQVGIPFLVFLEWTGRDAQGRLLPYPSSGSTVEWAYLLLAACLGFGVMMQRAQPGADFATRIKALIGR